MTHASLLLARRSDYRVVIEFVQGDPNRFLPHRYCWDVRDTSDVSCQSGWSDDPEEAATCALLAWTKVVEGVVEREMAEELRNDKGRYA